MKLASQLSIAAVALAVSSLAAQAATVVNFDGIANTYGAKSGLSLSPTQIGNDYIYAYSDSTAISPGAYTGPIFHGGGWMTSSGGTPAGFNLFQVRLKYPSPTGVTYLTDIEIGMTDHPGSTAGGAFMVSFLKQDFLGDTSATFSFDNTSSISMKVANGTKSEVRFAVLADGQWYLSEASTIPVANAGSPVFTLSGQTLLDSTWAAWDPTGGPNGRLGDLPTSFTVTGSSLENIEGVGYFSSYSAATSNQYVYMGQFSADLATVPEPTTAVLSAAGLLIVALRRRHGRNAK